VTETEFTEFVAGTKRIVLAAIRRYLNPALSHAIDDVAQETYLRAYRFIQNRGPDGLRPEQAKSWLYTIARNESQRMNETQIREDRKLKLVSETPPTNAGPIDRADPVSSEATADQELERIAGGDPELLAILRLRARNYRVREIAAKLNIAEGTIKSRLARLRKRVQAANPGDPTP
jgi:RNA polymerase sigma-70 factor (ECF subfamily)